MTTHNANWDRTERRTAQDRRTLDRRGKFDRRRNRCGRCQFFETPSGNDAGFCTQHQQPFTPDDFACASFKEKGP